jgi:sialate O-acetylesterase
MLIHKRVRSVLGLIAALGALAFAQETRADVKLPAIFGANMALQADKEVNVWGWADAGEEVTVKVDRASATTKAGADGKWRLKMPAHKAGGPYVMEVSGKNQIKLENVVYGQVWMIAGQSNVYWPVRLSKDAEAEAAKAKYPQIRLFTVTDAASLTPLENLKGKWEVCTPETAAMFSGAGYFMARKLHEELKQPVGMIAVAVGNSRINLWIADEVLKTDEDYPVMLARRDAMKTTYEKSVEKWEADMAALKEQAATRPATDTAPAPKPPAKPAPPNYLQSNDALGTRQHGMIHPLGPLTLAGMSWYQGESNVDRSVQYFRLLPLLISSYRAQFESPKLPVMIVQLPNMHGADRTDKLPPANAIWSELRAAQANTAANDPNVGLAVTIDIGGIGDEPPVIHPVNKQDVGDRLARKALAMVYGNKEIVHSGPVLKSQTIEGNKVRLLFENTQGGLVTSDDKAPRAFTLAGKDNVQYWADAVIDGDSVVVTCANVPEPAWVRYAWTNNPRVNLFGKGGLPVAPFRTDTLLLSTRLNH